MEWCLNVTPQNIPASEEEVQLQEPKFSFEHPHLAEVFRRNPGVWFEVGVYFGSTPEVLIPHLGETNSYYFGVDVWSAIVFRRIGWNDYAWDTVYTIIRKALDLRERSDRIYYIRGDSRTIGELWPLSIDSFFLDGDHSAEVVRAELLTYGPKIRLGGILSGHDWQIDEERGVLLEVLGRPNDVFARNWVYVVTPELYRRLRGVDVEVLHAISDLFRA